MSLELQHDIEQLKSAEERHRALSGHHADRAVCARTAVDRFLSSGGGDFASAGRAYRDSGGVVATADRSVGLDGLDEWDWGIMIYPTALVEGCRTIEEGLDALFDAYNNTLRLDDVVKALLKAGVSKAGGKDLSARMKSLQSTLYGLISHSERFRCVDKVVERLETPVHGDRC